ncbi:MAG: D-hexose-6-phosphate mutarotase [Chloroflexi bacterium]|nr:D-hexose-6-phosphate mutarotase [Chloroflexota bacterium]
MDTLLPADFPKVDLIASDQSRATVTPHGAHVVSWKTPDGRERLFLSATTDFGPGAALRGGVPVVFPQFAGLGSLPKHGFARNLVWDQNGMRSEREGTVTGRFRLRNSETTRQIWDHAFQLDLAVTVGGSLLEMVLDVTNLETQAFQFTAALHTYLRVGEIANVVVEGLEGLAYREYDFNGAQPQAPLHIVGEVDRVYWNVPGPVTVREGDQALQVISGGFPDVVVWNPGPERAAALPDMEPEGYRRMLCIEAAVIGQPVSLAPGATWHGTQQVKVLFPHNL